MRNNIAPILLVVGASILAVSVAAFAEDHWVGTWKLNVSKSKFNPGPASKSQTIKYEGASGGFKFTSDTMDAQGQNIQGGYTAKFDGKDYPWKNNPNADTVSLKRVDDYSYENAWKKSGQNTITSKVAISKDGKMLTNMQTGKNAQGQDVNHVLIYEKQ